MNILYHLASNNGLVSEVLSEVILLSIYLYIWDQLCLMTWSHPHLIKTVCTSCTAIVTMALENVIVKGDIIRQSGQKLNGLARRPIVFLLLLLGIMQSSMDTNEMTNTYKIDSLSLKFHLFLCQNPSACIKSNVLKDKHA